MKGTVKTEIETFYDNNGYIPGLYSEEDNLYLSPNADKEKIKDFATTIGCSEKLIVVLLALGADIKENDICLNEDIKELGRIVLE